MKLTAKFLKWEITCVFSKLLKMLASGSASTSRPPKGGFVVAVDLMHVPRNSSTLTLVRFWRCDDEPVGENLRTAFFLRLGMVSETDSMTMSAPRSGVKLVVLETNQQAREEGAER